MEMTNTEIFFWYLSIFILVGAFVGYVGISIYEFYKKGEE